MTLEEKGPLVPPPALTKYPQQVSEEVQSWSKVTAATHWEIGDSTSPNGADFYVGQQELGHIHLDGEIHLPMGKELSVELIKNKFAKKFIYAKDWITAPIQSATDASHAKWLFKLNYDRIMKVPREKLISEIGDYTML